VKWPAIGKFVLSLCTTYTVALQAKVPLAEVQEGHNRAHAALADHALHLPAAADAIAGGAAGLLDPAAPHLAACQRWIRADS